MYWQLYLLTWKTTAISEPSLCLASPRNVPSGMDKSEASDEWSNSCELSNYIKIQIECSYYYVYIFDRHEKW